MTTETAPAQGAEITYAEPEAGVYPGTFTACDNFKYEDKTTGETELRWRWTWWSDDDVEFDTLTSRSFRPGTNALKLFTGILGRAPVSGDKPSDSYGKHGSIVYSPNKGGKLTVTEFHVDRAKATAAPKPAATDQPMTALPNMADPAEFTGAPVAQAVPDKDELPF